MGRICRYCWPLIAKTAAIGGHIDVVRFCHERYGIIHFNKAMVNAAASGHIDIVCLCKEEYGATNFMWARDMAYGFGHTDIVSLLHQWQQK